MKTEYLARGTLGDAYIFCCKLIARGTDPVKVWHHTIHKYWIQMVFKSRNFRKITGAK